MPEFFQMALAPGNNPPQKLFILRIPPAPGADLISLAQTGDIKDHLEITNGKNDGEYIVRFGKWVLLGSMVPMPNGIESYVNSEGKVVHEETLQIRACLDCRWIRKSRAKKKKVEPEICNCKATNT